MGTAAAPATELDAAAPLPPPAAAEPPSGDATAVVDAGAAAAAPVEAAPPPPELPPAPVAVDPPVPAPEPTAADAGCDGIIAAARAAPPPTWTIRCAGPVPGLAARADPTAREIVLYVRSQWTVTEAARILGHELGHAFDWALLTDADRQAWMDARGLQGDWGSWCPRGAVCGDTDRPAGDWAEAVGEVLVPGTGMWCSELGAEPTPEQLGLVRSILASRGVAV